MRYRRYGLVGWFLVVVGAIGVVGGIVPFVVTTLRILVRHDLWGTLDFAAHGVEAIGLSLEWALLSSAMGTFLGGLLIWSGAGWLKERDWATVATWVYVACGLTVNVTDLLIFAFWARPGAMRTAMLVFDAIALLIPVALVFWLVSASPRPRGKRRGRGSERRPAVLPPLPPEAETPGATQNGT
jgi:hypothetical protein